MEAENCQPSANLSSAILIFHGRERRLHLYLLLARDLAAQSTRTTSMLPSKYLLLRSTLAMLIFGMLFQVLKHGQCGLDRRKQEIN